MTDPLIRRYAGMPTPRYTCLTEDDRARQAIIRQLMCAFRADLSEPARRNDLFKELALLRPMIGDGLVLQNGQEIAMTPLGRPFVRVAAAVFDPFRQGPAGGFSMAG
jgi:oxygen-independent coproporphyrinogen-3 oxidase